MGNEEYVSIQMYIYIFKYVNIYIYRYRYIHLTIGLYAIKKGIRKGCYENS